MLREEGADCGGAHEGWDPREVDHTSGADGGFRGRLCG